MTGSSGRVCVFPFCLCGCMWARGGAEGRGNVFSKSAAIFSFWLWCHILGLSWWLFLLGDIGWDEDPLFFPSRSILEVFYFGLVSEGSPWFVLAMLVSFLVLLVGGFEMRQRTLFSPLIIVYWTSLWEFLFLVPSVTNYFIL